MLVVVVTVVAVAGALVVGGSRGCLAGGSRTYGEAGEVAHLAHVHVWVVDEGALGAAPLVARLLHPLAASPLVLPVAVVGDGGRRRGCWGRGRWPGGEVDRCVGWGDVGCVGGAQLTP